MADIDMLKLDEYMVDVLMPDLVGHDRRPVCFLVYLWLAMEGQRRGTTVKVSYQELAESVGVSKSSAQSAVGWLVRRKLLCVTKQTVTATPEYVVLMPWRHEEGKGTLQKSAARGEAQAIRQVS